MASTPSSRKAKGRKLQQYVRDQIIARGNGQIREEDVRSAIMGESGQDVWINSLIQGLFFRKHIQIECKNQERVNVWKSYEQAANHGHEIPVLIIKKNRHRPLAVVDLKVFLDLLFKEDNDE